MQEQNAGADASDANTNTRLLPPLVAQSGDRRVEKNCVQCDRTALDVARCPLSGLWFCDDQCRQAMRDLQRKLFEQMVRNNATKQQQHNAPVRKSARNVPKPITVDASEDEEYDDEAQQDGDDDDEEEGDDGESEEVERERPRKKKSSEKSARKKDKQGKRKKEKKHKKHKKDKKDKKKHAKEPERKRDRDQRRAEREMEDGVEAPIRLVDTMSARQYRDYLERTRNLRVSRLFWQRHQAESDAATNARRLAKLQTDRDTLLQRLQDYITTLRDCMSALEQALELWDTTHLGEGRADVITEWLRDDRDRVEKLREAHDQFADRYSDEKLGAEPRPAADDDAAEPMQEELDAHDDALNLDHALLEQAPLQEQPAQPEPVRPPGNNNNNNNNAQTTPPVERVPSRPTSRPATPPMQPAVTAVPVFDLGSQSARDEDERTVVFTQLTTVNSNLLASDEEGETSASDDEVVVVPPRKGKATPKRTAALPRKSTPPRQAKAVEQPLQPRSTKERMISDIMQSLGGDPRSRRQMKPLAIVEQPSHSPTKQKGHRSALVPLTGPLVNRITEQQQKATAPYGVQLEAGSGRHQVWHEGGPLSDLRLRAAGYKLARKSSDGSVRLYVQQAEPGVDGPLSPWVPLVEQQWGVRLQTRGDIMVTRSDDAPIDNDLLQLVSAGVETTVPQPLGRPRKRRAIQMTVTPSK